MECPNCGASVASGQTRCRRCGSAVEAAAPSAPVQAAGQPVTVVIQQGPQQATGGYVAPPIDTTTPVKSRIVAGILGILLGWLGVHRFYMKDRHGIGIAQLLLTLLTCGYGTIVTWPWGIIEGVLILVRVIDRDGVGRPFKD